jgi:tetratricopeptide (TPR) repeat protein
MRLLIQRKYWHRYLIKKKLALINPRLTKNVKILFFKLKESINCSAFRYFASMKLILSFGLLFCFFTMFAQVIPERELYRRLDLGEEMLKRGEYEEANNEFLFVIENMKNLPPKIAYFFGRNSFHLGQYKQSINWLNKYIQLQGTSGPYYEQAVSFLDRAERQYIARQKSASTNDLYEASLFDCGGFEKMICPVCKGDGVIIKKNPFGKSYNTCHYCEGNAYLSCEDYNLFMQGKLSPEESTNN